MAERICIRSMGRERILNRVLKTSDRRPWRFVYWTSPERWEDEVRTVPRLPQLVWSSVYPNAFFISPLLFLTRNQWPVRAYNKAHSSKRVFFEVVQRSSNSYLEFLSTVNRASPPSPLLLVCTRSDIVSSRTDCRLNWISNQPHSRISNSSPLHCEAKV